MRENMVKTRKSHHCEWCPELIAAGEQAMSRAYIWDGDFQYGHLHPECWLALCASCSTIDEGFTLHEQRRGVACDCYGEPVAPKEPK